jgi:hypothetical protein
MPGYCWPTSFKVPRVLFLGDISSAFWPSKKACWTDKFRHWGLANSIVSFLGQHIVSILGLENQWIVHVVLRNPFRTLTQSTAMHSCNRCSEPSLQHLVLNALMACDYFLTVNIICSAREGSAGVLVGTPHLSAMAVWVLKQKPLFEVEHVSIMQSSADGGGYGKRTGGDVE